MERGRSAGPPCSFLQKHHPTRPCMERAWLQPISPCTASSHLSPRAHSPPAGSSTLASQHWLFLKNIVCLAQTCPPGQHSTAHIFETPQAKMKNLPRIQSTCFLLHPPCKTKQLPADIHPSRTPSPWLRHWGTPAKAGRTSAARCWDRILLPHPTRTKLLPVREEVSVDTRSLPNR